MPQPLKWVKSKNKSTLLYIIDDKYSLISMSLYSFYLIHFRGQGRNPSNNFVSFLKNLKQHNVFRRLSDLQPILKYYLFSLKKLALIFGKNFEVSFCFLIPSSWSCKVSGIGQSICSNRPQIRQPKIKERMREVGPQNKSLEGHSALKKGRMKAMFDFSLTEKGLQSKMCLRYELEKHY